MDLQESDNVQPVRRGPSLIWIAAVIGFAAIIAGAAVVARSQSQQVAVADFASCKEAGGTIAESYPEQCMIDGRSFTNESQVAQQPDDLIGLTEEQAFAAVERGGNVARVVMRDGKSLPVTMDHAPGRHNFSIVDGIVSRVSVETED